MIIQAFNGVDSLALGLALQDIKIDLRLSDSQLGLLSGIAFALFYAVMGIPLARWADRGNRVTLISLTTAVWSVMVAACAMAAGFWQLLLIRIGVGVGQAGCVPPAQSLIADYFPRGERPRAIAIYMLGANLSMFIGYFGAGWLNQLYGWRTMFLLLGLPGTGLSVLAWLTLQEPRLSQAASTITARSPGLKEAGLILWRNATFRHLLLAFSVFYFFGYGIQQWQPAFFLRSHGLETGELGTWFALIFGLGGLAGTYLGGAWSARHAAHDERLQLQIMAMLFIGFGAVSACVYLSADYHLAFGLIALSVAGISLANGPLFATVQTLVPPQLRALSIAIIYLFANLIGMGLGPLAVGALSDALTPGFGAESLRYALLALCPGFLWVSWHLWRASRTVTRDLPREAA